MTKRDFLRECMNDVGQLPIDEFNAAYCVRCANRECARSGLAAMSFDRRVANWQKDMFTNVPRASDDDPRFTAIRSKHFRSINPSVHNVSAPERPVSSGAAVTTPIAQPTASTPDSAPPESKDSDTSKAETTFESQPLVPTTSQSEAVSPIPASPVVAHKPQTYNTPFSQGAMLPGHEKKPEAETEIGSGGTFVFGGSDE